VRVALVVDPLPRLHHQHPPCPDTAEGAGPLRYFYDCEFIENGRTVELISIGIVAEDGREYYAVNADAPWRRIQYHYWLMDNVVPHLPAQLRPERGLVPTRGAMVLEPDYTHPDVKPKRRIADEVREFLLSADAPELWADYAAYDHVVLCQLWGRMIDLPAGIPMWTHDIQQLAAGLGNPPLPTQQGGEHNALADARHNQHRYITLQHLVGVRYANALMNGAAR
jgi:hypothetical protein